ncbi:MAG: hypothetical protein AAGA21_03640 [Pseudomonadota bacterium]
MDADELIVEIGRAVLLDERYRNEDWSGIALVGSFAHGRESMHGYVYRTDGSWTGCIPADPEDDILDKMLDLKRVMAEEKGAVCHQCLVQVSRTKQDVNVKFEYDDPQRWSVTPANLEQMVETLRPS